MFNKCKYCGNDDIEFVIVRDNNDGLHQFYVRCKKCHNRTGKPTVFKHKAFMDWQKENE